MGGYRLGETRARLLPCNVVWIRLGRDRFTRLQGKYSMVRPTLSRVCYLLASLPRVCPIPEPFLCVPPFVQEPYCPMISFPFLGRIFCCISSSRLLLWSVPFHSFTGYTDMVRPTFSNVKLFREKCLLFLQSHPFKHPDFLCVICFGTVHSLSDQSHPSFVLFGYMRFEIVEWYFGHMSDFTASLKPQLFSFMYTPIGSAWNPQVWQYAKLFLQFILG